MRQLQLDISYTELADNFLGKQNYPYARVLYERVERKLAELPKLK